MKNLTVLAIGGNAISADSHEQEDKNILKTFRGIEELIRRGPLVITHGNGPQVGRLLAKLKLPLWLHTGQTQGEISSLLQLNLRKYLKAHDIEKPIVSLMSHVLVDPKDTSFVKPVKPVGVAFNKSTAQKLKKQGLTVEQDARNPDFYRRLVPSPKPIDVIEIEAIKILLEQGCIVITGGGGGIPIQKTPAGPIPVEAVVDKDYTSSIIASRLKAETLIFLTNIEYAMISFGTGDQRPLENSDLQTAKNLSATFKTGMKTKIDASIDFLENRGLLRGQKNRKVLIGNVFKLREMLDGKSGTLLTN